MERAGTRARFQQHDVGGLQVAVDDALTVRPRQRIGNLRPALEGLCQRQRASAQAPQQRVALEMLHHQEVNCPPTGLFGADIVKRADIRVVEGRDGACLVLESA